MFVETSDEEHGLVVWIFTGPSNTEADYQTYCDSIERLTQLSISGWRIGILIVDAGNPMPNARWRREIARVSTHVPGESAFILVGSPLARGVATAVNWLRPPTYLLRTASSFEDAVKVAEELAGRPLPRLEVLHRRARAATQR